MLFGRAFEQAVAALFRREDPAAVLFEQCGLCKDMGLSYSGNDTWDRTLQQGVQLLGRFARDNRICIRRSRSRQEVQFNRSNSATNSPPSSMTRSDESSPDCFCRTAAFAFHKTRACLAHSSGCAPISKIWSKLLSCARPGVELGLFDG
jgi:hypothetical protein